MDWNLACNAKKEAENEDMRKIYMRKKSAKHCNFLLLKERLYNLCEKKVFWWDLGYSDFILLNLETK